MATGKEYGSMCGKVFAEFMVGKELVVILLVIIGLVIVIAAIRLYTQFVIGAVGRQ